MRGTGILLMRSAVSDMAVDDDQGRYVVGASEDFDGLRSSLRIIGVANSLHVPAVGQKARRDIVAKGEICVAFDRYAVAVVEPAKVPEHQMTRERGGFAGDAFHHVAIATYCINVVIEHCEIGPVEVLGQPMLGDRHADARRTPLPKRAGCCLNACGHMIFGVARALAVDFTEVLDVIERDGEFLSLIHISEPTRQAEISYAVFCLKK